MTGHARPLIEAKTAEVDAVESQHEIKILEEMERAVNSERRQIDYEIARQRAEGLQHAGYVYSEDMPGGIGYKNEREQIERFADTVTRRITHELMQDGFEVKTDSNLIMAENSRHGGGVPLTYDTVFSILW